MLQEYHELFWQESLDDERARAAFVESVRDLMEKKRRESEARGDTGVYIHLLFRVLCRVTAQKTRAAIAETFPEAVVTGMSETLFGNENNTSVLKVSFTFLQRSRVQLLEYLGPPADYEKAGKVLDQADPRGQGGDALLLRGVHGSP